MEQRIEALSDERQRGDAFEVFTEAYLATQRPHDAHTLWPQSAAPVAVLQSLGLTVRDNGVDGVLQSPVGLLSVYQAKFRSGRAALTWRELSTFIGLADSSQIHSRILFTNSDDIPSLMNERRGFFCIRGADLERLEEFDFVAIERWLAGSPVDVPKKEPLPHQQEAIAAILPALEQHGRATAVMACGTGKSLVALWVAERSQATKILVLLPSLALVRQTLHEWLHETRWSKLAYLCVCSDPTVTSDIDSLSVQQTDLDFEVNTDSKTVRAFLDADFQGTRLVFCTYQSAHIVAAAMGEDEAFDLGIFDEAHKTAGRVGVRFAFAVADQNLLIRKRLFLTATPRHYDYRKKDKEGDAKLVYSMDVPEVYGPVAVKLTFAEAARRQIICPYKVAISIVTSATVNNERLRRGEVIIDGDRVRAIQVANQIALQKAVAQFGVSKIFTFHRSIKSAESFTSDASEGIAIHLPDFARLHVNGNMSTAVRDGLMRSFAEAPKAVMSNARCLTEGVDVPAVDMVAFLTPKRSLIEIVQATGRAMRRSPNKQFGYVLVPLFLEQHEGESIEGALSRTTFREVWKVLGVMLEQDELFAQVIRQMREDRGERGGFDDSTFHELVEVLSDDIPLDAIRKHITVVSMERFGFSWDEWYGQLKAYKAATGHCDVRLADEAHRFLNRWIQRQRNLRRNGQVSEDRIQRLDLLGFNWGTLETLEQSKRAAWEDRLEELTEYRSRFGNCDVSAAWPENPSLAAWVSRMRRRRREDRLSESQIVSLDSLGFSWCKREDLNDPWKLRLQQLADYKRRFGHCNVSATWEENPSLGVWINHVRALRRQGRLSVERIAALDAIRFAWSLRNRTVRQFDWNGVRAIRRARVQELRNRTVRRFDWNAMFSEFVAIQKEQDTPRPILKAYRLVQWAARMRRDKVSGKLTERQIKALDAIGFEWTTLNDRWNSMLVALADYHRTYGDCNVPKNWPGNPRLGSWVRTQLQKFRDETIHPELRQRLEELGFDFSEVTSHEYRREDGFTALLSAIHNKPKRTADECRWEDGFTALQQYKAQHGHCNVPSQPEENPTLAAWISVQRARMKAGSLTEQQIQRLNELGFIWDLHEFKWRRMYDELTAYKLKNGHCWIPISCPKNPRLASWVSAQRNAIKEGGLSKERISLLDAIGFIWRKDSSSPTEIGFVGSLHDQKWQQMFDELVKYKQQYGNCDIPMNWPTSPRLAGWVSSQRTAKKTGKLPAYRFQLLDELGFIWQKNRGRSSLESNGDEKE